LAGGVDGNNALSGIDGALWTSWGSELACPCNAFLGGKVRKAIPLYATIESVELNEVEDQIRKAMSEGYRHVKIGLTSGATSAQETQSQGKGSGLRLMSFDPWPYVNETIKMFDYVRTKIGFDVELIHTVHGEYHPRWRLMLGKTVEPYRLFFIEDLFARRTLVGINTYATRLVHRSEQANFSQTATTGCHSLPIDGSISSVYMFLPSAASTWRAK